MSTFFTADLHLWHTNLLKYVPARGARWNTAEEMNQEIKSLWNAKVTSEGDEVYILGDLAFNRNTPEIIDFVRELRGRKHLIFGNHDQIVQKNKAAFLEVFETLVHTKEIRVERQSISLCHFAHRVWNKSHHGAWHLFGHSHGTLSPWGKSVDVGIDSAFITGQMEFRPFSFEEIKNFMDRQTTFP